jgi:hypothetical protein
MDTRQMAVIVRRDVLCVPKNIITRNAQASSPNVPTVVEHIKPTSQIVLGFQDMHDK